MVICNNTSSIVMTNSSNCAVSYFKKQEIGTQRRFQCLSKEQQNVISIVTLHWCCHDGQDYLLGDVSNVPFVRRNRARFIKQALTAAGNKCTALSWKVQTPSSISISMWPNAIFSHMDSKKRKFNLIRKPSQHRELMVLFSVLVGS